jgi:competence protein ComGF
MNFSINNIYKYFLLLTVICLVGNVSADNITVKTTLERDTILPGDQITLQYELEQSVGIKMLMPELPDTIGEDIEVIKREPLDTTELDDNKLLLKQSYTITSFDSGLHVIPPFLFILEYDELVDTIKTDEIQLFVASIDVDLEKGPADIKKPFSAPITFKEIAPWLFAVILIGALAFFIIYAIQRRRRNMPVFSRPEKPKEAPHKIALRELNIVKSEELWKQGHVKEYYSRVTDIIRTYIEDRFDVPAMEETSFEILNDLKNGNAKVDSKSMEELKHILELSDLVKFAKLQPLQDDNQITIAKAYFFVQQTKIEEMQTPEKPEESTSGDEETVEVEWSDNKGRKKP